MDKAEKDRIVALNTLNMTAEALRVLSSSL